MFIAALKVETLFIFFIILALCEFFHRLTLFPLLKNLDELVIFTLPFILFNKRYWLLALFPVTLLLISFYKEIDFIQLLLDIKFFLICFLTLTFTFYRESLKLENYLKLYFFVILFVFFFEFFFNQTYEKFLLGDYIATYMISDSEYHRYSSIFVHPGELAVYCITSIVALTCMKINFKGRYLIVSILSLMLLLTFQRFEIFTFICLFFLYFIFEKKWYNISHSIVFVTIIFLSFTYVYFSFFHQLYIDHDQDPRTAMYIASFDIFSDAFISGIGPGNFASHMSVGNYRYYDYTGIANLWWFDGSRYLTDTFWPKIFSEYGAIGFLIYSSFFIYLLHKSKHNNCLLFMIVFIFIVSLQSPIVFNIYIVLYVLLLSAYVGSKNKGFS